MNEEYRALVDEFMRELERVDGPPDEYHEALAAVANRVLSILDAEGVDINDYDEDGNLE